MSILVYAEHDNHQLKAASYKLITAALEVAQHNHGEVVVLVAGSDCAQVAQQATTIAGVDKVLLADQPQYQHQLPETISKLVLEHIQDFSHLMASATSMGKSFMPRVAALLDVAQISEITAVESDDTFVRPSYAGNAIVKLKSKDSIKVITVRAASFESAQASESDDPAEIEVIDTNVSYERTEFVSIELNKSNRPALATAETIVSVGKGLPKDGMPKVEKIADQLGAAIGASRGAIDEGFVSGDFRVGLTGATVAPQLYMALGISGAINHVSGIKDSKIIVGINIDKEAPIFDVADYGLVGDLNTVLPELEQALKESK